MVEHRSHSAGLEYDASAGWKLRKLGRDIRRRRRHLRLVDDSAVSSHDANLRFRHRHVQPGKILHVDSPLPRQSRSYRLLQKSRDHYPMLKKSKNRAGRKLAKLQSDGTSPFNTISDRLRTSHAAQSTNWLVPQLIF